MTKKLVVITMMFFAALAIFAQQRMAGEAMALLRDASMKMKNARSLNIDFTMKLSVMPTINMKLQKVNDRMSLQIEDETTYFYNHIMWICDQSDKSVIIQGQRDDSEQMLALMALMPDGFSEDGRVLSDKSFVIGQYVFTVNRAKDDFVLSSKIDRTSITIIINSKTGKFGKLKVKRGLLTLSFIYNEINYSCSEDRVIFTVAKYPNFKIKDNRNTM